MKHGLSFSLFIDKKLAVMRTKRGNCLEICRENVTFADN